MNLFQEHLSRVRMAVGNVYSLTELDGWICKNTYLNGELFRFKNHEYQLPSLQDKAKTTIIVKAAQVGLSELAFRYAIAAVCNVENLTIIFTMPTSGDAEKMNTTRISPMIDGSPEVLRLVDKNLNNSEIKKFQENSFIFFRGTRSATQALSTPADILINDEWDASDTTQASVYLSRLQHKETKIRKIFSTPTVRGYGVSLEAEMAKRYRHVAKCLHCSHMFLPDFFQHVVVPGWGGSVREITKRNLHETQWREAYLACPKCGKDPELDHTRQSFICENSAEDHAANAYFVSPFSAPRIISPSYLVEASTKFAKYSEFCNQCLGITAEEEDDAITEEDLDLALVKVDLGSSELHYMGVDIGLLCHVAVGRLAHDGTLLVVHREQVPYTNLEVRARELSVIYKVVTSVFDSMPYTDLITRICARNPNSWGAIFTSTKTPESFTVHKQAADPKEGQMALRLVKVNRNVALDSLLGVIKSKSWKVQAQDSEDGEFRAQMRSLKKVQTFDKDGGLQYVWQKTGAQNDHSHFSLLYLHIATQMRGTAGSAGAAGIGVPLVTKFRLTT